MSMSASVYNLSHTYIQPCIPIMYTHVYTHAHPRMPMQLYVCTFSTNMYIYINTPMLTQVHKVHPLNGYTHLHTATPKYIHVHSCTQICIHGCTLEYIHLHLHTRVHTCTLVQSYVHNCTHMCTHVQPCIATHNYGYTSTLYYTKERACTFKVGVQINDHEL